MLEKETRKGYITDGQGNRIGVLLGIEKYQKLLEESEELDAIRADDLTVSDNWESYGSDIIF